jgi:hypothetical protein
MNNIEMYADEVIGGRNLKKGSIIDDRLVNINVVQLAIGHLANIKRKKNDFQLPYERNCTLGCCCDVGSSFVE